MSIAHLLCDSIRDKAKITFLGDMPNGNTLFVVLTEFWFQNLDII